MERIDPSKACAHKFPEIVFDACFKRVRIHMHHNETGKQKKEVHPQVAFLDKMVEGTIPRCQRKRENINMEKKNQKCGETAERGE